MGAEQARLVEQLLTFWSGDIVAKLADEEFMGRVRDSADWVVGTEWEFEAAEGSQALGMTSGHKGLEGFLAIWERWVEAFERWDAQLAAPPVALERERVLAHIRVQARSHAGVEMDFEGGLLYSFDGLDLRRVQAYATWEQALAATGVTAERAEELEREAARERQLD